jgi:hypothetical protein
MASRRKSNFLKTTYTVEVEQTVMKEECLVWQAVVSGGTPNGFTLKRSLHLHMLVRPSPDWTNTICEPWSGHKTCLLTPAYTELVHTPRA